MIRRYTEKDRIELLKILELNIPEYFHPSEYDDFQDYLANKLEDYFVIMMDQQIVGSGGLNYPNDGTAARISWDLIHPEYHGKGLGKELTEYRIKLALENPIISTIRVRTSQFAFRFYEKMGFILTDIQKDFWAEGYDLYDMGLDLD